jgi:hypothetical protein
MLYIYTSRWKVSTRMNTDMVLDAEQENIA